MRTYTGIITSLPMNGILVFGSNTQGRHGKGVALLAKQKFGAINGQAMGLQGRSYAIVTKDLTKKIHPSITQFDIGIQIAYLYMYAKFNPDKDFYIAYSGTGVNLNGYSPKIMASIFSYSDYGSIRIPENIIFEEEFAKLIESNLKQD